MPESSPSFPWLHWLHHASFRIESGGKVIFMDPYKVKRPTPADFILVTHAHRDHFSPKDILALAKPGTVLVGPAQVAAKAASLGLAVLEVAPGAALDLGGIRGRAVESYNLGKPMHPKKLANVGYILDLPEGRLYHAGDTDVIPEMAGFEGVHLALLPVGTILGFLKPTMTPAQAVEAVRLIQPRWAAPMHYGMLPGSKGDGAAFLRGVGGTAALLTEEEPL
jgi:L-ascorbate metabolism protein UlaG (beta-lactamase superfamily)